MIIIPDNTIENNNQKYDVILYVRTSLSQNKKLLDENMQHLKYIKLNK